MKIDMKKPLLPGIGFYRLKAREAALRVQKTYDFYERCKKNWTGPLYQTIRDSSGMPFGIIEKGSGDTVWISFRGTENAKEWFEDAEFCLVDFFKGRVERGFRRVFDSLIFPTDMPEMPGDLYITGHSLGGG